MRTTIFLLTASVLCTGCNPQPAENAVAEDTLYLLTPFQARIQLSYAEETVHDFGNRTDSNSRKITKDACGQRTFLHQELDDMLGKDAPPKKRELDATCAPFEA